jgi:CubicO group peptidase (beta-lactamase class C family)
MGASVRPVSLAVVAALLCAAPLSAHDRAADIDRIFSFAAAETPGCAVAVSQRDRMIVNKAYGLSEVDRRVPLSDSSVFDIGSTQKQFTAAAILLLVEDRRLALTDDIRRYIPELPDYGARITIDHLLTHTGGIRDWTGLLPSQRRAPRCCR